MVMITYSILLSASIWNILKKNILWKLAYILLTGENHHEKISIKIGNLWLIFLYDTPILLGLNMKLLFLVCFLAVLPQFSNGKNYYLVNDEKSASEYVYGLFGLTNVVGKLIWDFNIQVGGFRQKIVISWNYGMSLFLARVLAKALNLLFLIFFFSSQSSQNMLQFLYFLFLIFWTILLIIFISKFYLWKYFLPNFSAQIFRPKFFGPNFFRPNFFGPNFFSAQFFFGPIFFRPNYFSAQFFLTKFFQLNFFCAQFF